MPEIPQEASRGEVHLWLCEPEKITEPLLLQRYLSWLSPEEDAKRQRYRFERHQHQYLITRALIKSLLSHYYPETPPSDWCFQQNEWGKPSLVDGQNTDNLHFNLSHTDGLICCAFTIDHLLGVDVENITREGETVKIADRYFSPEEHQSLIELPDEKQDDRFFDLWTLKESYIKAWGKGLAIPLDQFSFAFGEDDDRISGISLATKAEREDEPDKWRFWNWQYQQEHRVSLGIKCPDLESEEINKIDVNVISCVPLISQSPSGEKLKARH